MYFHVILFYYGDDIRNDELQIQIDALRGEVRALSESFTYLKQDDLRAVLGGQIKPILLEKIDHYFSNGRNGSPKGSEASKSWAELIDLVSEAVRVFQREGKIKALQYLDEREQGIKSSSSVERFSGYSALADDLFGRLRSYYELSDRVLMPSLGTFPQETAPSPAKPILRLSPALVEQTLAPLANSWRISILMLLSRDDDGLAALSRSLGLKKGHLQFHLKVLIEAGHIDYDRKSHLYSITAKGVLALDGLSKLIGNLASA